MADRAHVGQQVVAMFSHGPRNLFVVTGAVSRHLVLDIDGEAGEAFWRGAGLGEAMDATACVRTGKGSHYWFRIPVGVAVVKSQKGEGWDLQADGKGVIAPPSIHPSGKPYIWLEGRGIETAVEAPPALLGGAPPPASGVASPTPSVGPRDAVGAHAPPRERFDTEAVFRGVAAGGRDDTAYRFALSMRAKGVSKPQALVLMEEAWARMEQPAGDEFLLETALEKVERVYREKPEGRSPGFESVRAEEAGSARGPSVATQLVVAAEARYEFFQSQEGEPYAVALEGPRIAQPLRGNRSLRAELAAGYFDRTGNAAGNGALSDALAVLEGRALAAPRQVVAVRLAGQGGRAVLDLGDPSGRVVVVDAEGWSLVESSPVLFRRSELTSPMPEPSRGASLDPMRDLLNVGDEAWSLLVGYMVAAWVPEIPRPVLWLTGEQGAGKTSAMRMIASLLDPSPAASRASPRDIQEWVVSARQSLVIPVDNVSAIPAWLSDAICRTVTGDALVRRKLYTDDDLAVSSLQRVVLLNGIGVGSLRGDLADRLVPVEFERITNTKRRLDARLREEWEALHPGLLGALLDLLAGVLAELPSVEIDSMPRMADFARVLAAVDAVRGTSSLATYLDSRGRISEQVVEGDDVATAVRGLVERHASQMTTHGEEAWVGTASELLAALQAPDRPGPEWPTNPQQMSVALRRAAPDLARMGVHSAPPNSNKRKHWRLWLEASA